MPLSCFENRLSMALFQFEGALLLVACPVVDENSEEIVE